MIPIVYFRSSSFNAHRSCPTSFYGEYVLGIRGNSGKKADKGTITHKILELMALCKKAEQDGIHEIDDEDIGLVFSDVSDPEYVNTIATRVYEHYVKKCDYHTGKNAWTNKDFKDCLSWAWKALDFNGGQFDPRKRDVIAAEPHFDFEIERPWAKYNYKKQGLEGYLKLKGTIDLVTDLGDGVYEVIDWKTGRRSDWATGKEYTQSNMKDNPQMRLYHWACKTLYPEAHTLLMTMYFINEGGPFTVHYDDDDLKKTEEMVRDRFQIIKATEHPKYLPQIDKSMCWKCRYVCDLGKTTFENTHIKPEIEQRYGQRTRYGDYMTKCEQIRYMIKRHGIEWVTENYIDPEHTHGRYGQGGGKIQD